VECCHAGLVINKFSQEGLLTLIEELSKPPVPERLLEYVDEGGLSAEEFHARFTAKSVPSPRLQDFAAADFPLGVK
jgi:hypothetical protein